MFDSWRPLILGIPDRGFSLFLWQSSGSRFSSSFFLDSCVSDGTHGCCYLLATDMDMNSVAGYQVASWQQGYGDLHFVPDMTTLRRASW